MTTMFNIFLWQPQCLTDEKHEKQNLGILVIGLKIILNKLCYLANILYKFV